MRKALPATYTPLVEDISQLVATAKQRAAAAINNEITLLYWHVGNRIRQEVLGGERADYGKQVIATLATELTAQYGKGWSKRNLAQMVKFAEVFTDANIMQTLSAQLSWSHFVILCAIDDPLKRDFYTSMAMQEQKLQNSIAAAKQRRNNQGV
jgi:hypothetical protein